jgi:hypothetical protein
MHQTRAVKPVSRLGYPDSCSVIVRNFSALKEDDTDE